MTAVDRPTSRADCGCDLSVGPNAVHLVDGHPDPRPSVTDNARAEAEKRWPRYDDDAAPYSRGAFIGFLRGAEWAAGRAETTTATNEDAVEVAYRMAYDVMRYHPGIWHDSLRAAVEALASRGLLATARTRPTREQVSAAIGDAANPTQVGFGVVSIAAAVDAVLALLGGDDCD